MYYLKVDSIDTTVSFHWSEKWDLLVHTRKTIGPGSVQAENGVTM